MGEAHTFLLSIYNKFENLEKLLRQILRQEGILEANALVKKGFIIKSYSVKISKIEPIFLEKLKKELETVRIIENNIIHELRDFKERLEYIEKAYCAYNHEKLSIATTFRQYMNNAFSLAKLVIIRVKEIEYAIQNGANVHEKHDGSNLHELIKSLGRTS